jgi:hypothetical protein
LAYRRKNVSLLIRMRIESWLCASREFSATWLARFLGTVLLFVFVFSRFFVPQNHSFHPPQGEQPDTRYVEQKPSVGAFVRHIVCQAAKVCAVFVGPSKCE